MPSLSAFAHLAMEAMVPSGRLPEAVASLVHAGASVEVGLDVEVAEGEPVAVQGEGVWTTSVRGEWSTSRLVKRTSPLAGEWSTTHAASGRAFTLRVRGLAPEVAVLAEEALDWHSIYRTAHGGLRLSVSGRGGRRTTFSVKAYSNGLLVSHESFPCTHSGLAGVSVCMDASSAAYTVEAERFPSVVQDASAFALLLLVPEWAADLGRSKRVRALLKAASHWKSELRHRWSTRLVGKRTPEALFAMVADGAVPDEYVALFDTSLLVEQASAGTPRIHMVGMGMLRRMNPFAAERGVVWSDTASSEWAIRHVWTVPISTRRFSKLVRAGGASMLRMVCEHGYILGEGDDRALVLPYDAVEADVGLAIASLLTCSIQVEQELPHDLTLAWSEKLRVESNGSGGVHPGEELVPYYVSVDTRLLCLVLVRDAGLSPVFARESVSVDEVDVSTIDLDPMRTRHDDLRRFFPMMEKRLQALETDPLDACLREVYSRRVCAEWSLDGLDTGKNASSLGLSILLAMALGGWAGAQVRVYLGSTRAACMGYRTRDGRFQLVDPTRTSRNMFDIQPLPDMSSSSIVVKRGLLLQVLCQTNWRSAQVTRVNPLDRTAEVRFLSNDRRLFISLASHSWRRLARGDNEDTDGVLRTLLKRPATASAVDQGMTKTVVVPSVGDKRVKVDRQAGTGLPPRGERPDPTSHQCRPGTVSTVSDAT